MKRLLLLLVCLIPLLSFGQASVIFSPQATPQDTSANNYVWIGAGFRFYVAKMDSLKIKYFHVKKWLPDTLNKYMKTSVGLDSMNSMRTAINSKANNSVLSNYYLASNPAGYISSYTETDPTFNTKFGLKTTTDLTEGTNQYFTNGRARTSISAGTGISYNNTTGVITNSAPNQVVSLTSGTGISVTGTYPNFIITNSNVAPSLFTNVNRTLNSNFTISTTKEAFVKYDVTLSVTNPLIAGVSTADAYLEYSTNGGTNWITVTRSGNSSGVGLAVAIAITNTQTVSLIGWIPINGLVRIRTVITGTASVVYVTNSGQERY